MAKKAYFNQEARKKLQKGIDLAADAVGSTLGARGKSVIIAPGYGHMPIATKDGVTVAKAIFIEDEVENVGVMMIRSASQKTVDDAGDGTTTSAVLAQSMITAGLDAIEVPGANAQAIKAGMEMAVTAVVEALKTLSIPVTDSATLKSVATISANNDVEIGSKIAEAYEKIGHSGVLTIDKSHTVDTYITVLEGSEMPRGYSNDRFVTNPNKMTVEYDKPLILVADYELNVVKEVLPLMEEFSKIYNFTVQPLIIIARGFGGELHNTMVVNRTQRGAKICLIEAPNAYQKEALTDIATLTGATIIADDAGLKPEHARLEHLGTCNRIIVSRTSTLIMEGVGEKSAVEELKGSIQKIIDECGSNLQKKEIYERRLARLSGSIGVIYVGGATDLEQKERHDRVDDANRAVKSAIEEGIVPGGGIALLRAVQNSTFKNVSADTQTGIDIIVNACYAPLRKMLSNAGENVDLVFNTVQAQSGTKGFNIKTGEYVDMIEANIIDPTKVVRCALQNAASVAGQIINSDVLLVELKPTA
ncbi:MAG: molecular chaperone GroEL [Bacteroidota bacterium]